MTNPNIYKTIIGGAAIQQLNKNKDKKYESDMLIILPNKAFSFTSKAKLSVRYTFGFSNSSSDLANPEKLVTDILVKKYGFDDRQIYEMHLSKVIVKKGFEFIDIQIEEI